MSPVYILAAVGRFFSYFALHTVLVSYQSWADCPGLTYAYYRTLTSFKIRVDALKMFHVDHLPPFSLLHALLIPYSFCWNNVFSKSTISRAINYILIQSITINRELSRFYFAQYPIQRMNCHIERRLTMVWRTGPAWNGFGIYLITYILTWFGLKQAVMYFTVLLWISLHRSSKYWKEPVSKRMLVQLAPPALKIIISFISVKTVPLRVYISLSICLSILFNHDWILQLRSLY